jgi:AraC-like DNA-binding protein
MSRLLVTTPLVSLGEFRCTPGDARWSDENWIGSEHHLVFPRHAVRIRHVGAVGTEIADPTVVVIYPPDGRYERELVDPRGDECVFLTLAPELAGEPSFARLRAGFAPATGAAYAVTTLMAEHARRAEVDPLLAEEALHAAVADALGTHAAIVDAGALSRDAVDDARAVLATRYAERLSLSDVAGLVGLSPFHLARLFRRRTGTTMHGYREQVRLRISLHMLADHRRDLARLALELGYSSHSHFATSFRRVFGASPSAVTPPSEDLRTILKAARPPGFLP